MFDLLSFLKLLSAVLAGLFGVIGILGEPRDKLSNKLTIWGYLTLVGILVSTTFSSITQILEQDENAAEKARLAEATKTILLNSQRSASNLDRMVFKIGKPKLSIELTNQCGEDTKNFCKAYARAAAKDRYVDPKSIKANDSPFQDIALYVFFFKLKEDYEDTLSSKANEADLRYLIEVNSSYQSHAKESAGNDLLTYPGTATASPEYSIDASNINVIESDGKIISTSDLADGYFLMIGLPRDTKIRGMEFVTESGVRVILELDGCRYDSHELFTKDMMPTIYNHYGQNSIGCHIKKT